MLVDLTLILRAKEDAGAIGTPRQNVSAPLQREVVDNFRPDQRIHPLAPIQGCQPLELTRAEQNLPPAAAIATPGTLEAQILRKRERGPAHGFREWIQIVHSASGGITNSRAWSGSSLP